MSVPWLTSFIVKTENACLFERRATLWTSPVACSWICFESCPACGCVLLPQTPGLSQPSFSSKDWRKLSGSPNHSQDTPAQFPSTPRVCLLLGSAKAAPQPPDQHVYHMPVTFLANGKVNHRCHIFSNQAVPSDVFSYPWYRPSQAVYLRCQNFYYYTFLIGVCFLISTVVLLLLKRSGSLYEETIVHFVSICQTFQWEK